MMSPQPPRLFRALLGRLLPDDARETLIADLQAMFAKRVDRHGAFRARMWYRAQTISFAAPFGWERVFGRWRRGSSIGSEPNLRRDSLLPSFSLLDWELGFRGPLQTS